MLNWEIIEQNQAGTLSRVKVPNGWLVKEAQEVYLDIDNNAPSILNNNGYTWTTSITFVPDSNHEWLIENTK